MFDSSGDDKFVELLVLVLINAMQFNEMKCNIMQRNPCYDLKVVLTSGWTIVSSVQWSTAEERRHKKRTKRPLGFPLKTLCVWF